jgi:hypothetical protein
MSVFLWLAAVIACRFLRAGDVMLLIVAEIITR